MGFWSSLSLLPRQAKDAQTFRSRRNSCGLRRCTLVLGPRWAPTEFFPASNVAFPASKTRSTLEERWLCTQRREIEKCAFLFSPKTKEFFFQNDGFVVDNCPPKKKFSLDGNTVGLFISGGGGGGLESPTDPSVFFFHFLSCPPPDQISTPNMKPPPNTKTPQI